MKNLMLILVLSFALPVFAQEADLESDDQQLDGTVIDVQNLEEAGTPKTEVATANDSKKKKKKKDGEKPDASEVEGGDTYNFYFQKGDGPGSVNQGGAQKTESAPAPQSRATLDETDETFSRIEGHIGMMYAPDRTRSGLVVGGQFNATRTFGFQLHFLSSMSMGSSDSNSSFGAGGSYDESNESSSSGASFGVSYAPFNFVQGKVPVRIAAIGGMMYIKTEYTRTVSSFGAGGSHDSVSSYSDSKTMAFAGVQGTAKIAKNFAVVGYGKLTSDPEYSHLGVSAAWLF